MPAARALSPTPPLRRCGLYKTCEPKKCGKKWRQRLKPAVYEIERPKSAAELKAAGRSAAELKAMGFSAAALKAAGFSAAELKAAGFSAAELKAAGIFTTKSELVAALKGDKSGIENWDVSLIDDFYGLVSFATPARVAVPRPQLPTRCDAWA